MADDVLRNKATVIERSLLRMVGFRNEAVHEYQEFNLAIVQSIVANRLLDFTQFTERGLTTNGVRALDS